VNLIRIAIGDLKRVAKDKLALFWLLIMPLAMAYMFGTTMHGGGAQATWIPVIDLDCHELSALFIDQLRQEGYWIEVKNAAAQSDLKSKWPYGLVIQQGFGESILAGKKITVPLVKGNCAPDKLLEVQSRVVHAVVRFTTALIEADVSHRPWDDTSRANLEAALNKPQLLTVTRQSHRTLRPPPTGFSQSLPGMLVMFVLQMVITYGGTSLVSDRMGGQMRRLFAGPLGRVEIY